MPYQDHRNFDQYANPSEITVWRYMSLETLLCVLKNQTLRFTKITEWDDLIEGHAEPFTIETLSKELDVTSCPQYIVDEVNNLRINAKRKMFANCWCVNDNENILMWDSSYGRSNNENVGVAIKTTLDVLYSSIIDERNIYSGVIIYEKFPFTPKIGNVYIDCVVKDIQYQDEREHRMFYLGEESDAGDNLKHKYIKVDTTQLIKEIFVNPSSTTEDYDYVLKSIIECDSNLQFKLNCSSIQYKKRDYIHTSEFGE